MKPASDKCTADKKPPMTPAFQAMQRVWNREHNEWLKSVRAASDCTYKKSVTVKRETMITCDCCPGKQAGILPIGKCHEFAILVSEAGK